MTSVAMRAGHGRVELPCYQLESYSPIEVGALRKCTHDRHLEVYREHLEETNALVAAIRRPSPQGDCTAARERESLGRRLSYELGGLRLHELYFEQLQQRGACANPPRSSILMEAMDLNFGGFERWCSDFRQVAPTRGIGWAVTVWDAPAQHLTNLWVDLHHLAMPPDQHVLFAVDLWEHAYWVDYGARGREQYIEDLLATTDWGLLEARCEAGARSW